MTSAWPRYLLFADTIESPRRGAGWRFVLSAIDSPHTIAAEDFELGDPSAGEAQLERMELMAALRGLEALDQPSLVTLVSPSRYVRRGFERGLKQWREGGWKWESFGRRVLIRDHDLWRRVDRTLEFHRVDCRSWRFDSPAAESAGEHDVEPRVAMGRVEASRRPEDWVAASRVGSDPALLVVSPPRRARRSVIRFDTEQATPAPAGLKAAAVAG